MKVYLVMCQYYEAVHIEKAFVDEKKANKYAETQREKWGSKTGWYVEELNVEE